MLPKKKKIKLTEYKYLSVVSVYICLGFSLSMCVCMHVTTEKHIELCFTYFLKGSFCNTVLSLVFFSAKEQIVEIDWKLNVKVKP